MVDIPLKEEAIKKADVLLLPFKEEEQVQEEENLNKPKPKPIALLTIKEEEVEEVEEEEMDDTVDEINSGSSIGRYADKKVLSLSSSSSSSCVVWVKPMQGLQETGPTPFLRKTFEMVEDPETDEVVSWSERRDSFVVWDAHEFAKHLIPKYFKHSNFSSFIRQLNTYGFRKIDPDRWEFANEGFQGGKKHLLKNIKRRSRYDKNHQQVSISRNNESVQGPGSESELETLKNDQEFLRMEILKLKQQQEDSQDQMVVVEERIRAAEGKQLQMFAFLSKAARNPRFVQQLIQRKRKLQEELDGGDQFCKKKRLLQTESCPRVCLPDVKSRNQAQEQLGIMQSELVSEILLPEEAEDVSPISELFGQGEPAAVDAFDSPVKDHRIDAMCVKKNGDVPSLYNQVSENLLDENTTVESLVDEGLINVNDTSFYLELEDLIGKPRTWGGFESDMMERLGFVAPIVQ